MLSNKSEFGLHRDAYDLKRLYRELSQLIKFKYYGQIAKWLLKNDKFLWQNYEQEDFGPSLKHNLSNLSTKIATLALLAQDYPRILKNISRQQNLNYWLGILKTSIFTLVNQHPVKITRLIPPHLLTINPDPSSQILIGPKTARLLCVSLVNCFLNANQLGANLLICLPNPLLDSSLTSIIVANDGPPINKDVFCMLGHAPIRNNDELGTHGNGIYHVTQAARGEFGITMVQVDEDGSLNANSMALLNLGVTALSQQDQIAKNVFLNLTKVTTSLGRSPPTVATIFFGIPPINR